MIDSLIELIKWFWKDKRLKIFKPFFLFNINLLKPKREKNMKYPKILHLWYSDKTQTIYSSESSFSIKDNESLNEVIDFINLLTNADFTTINMVQIFNILEDIDTALRVGLGEGELLVFPFGVQMKLKETKLLK